MASIQTITDRIAALMGDVSGIAMADDEYPADLNSHLPFCFVSEGNATFTSIDSNRVEVNREWVLTVYVAKFTDEVVAEENAAYAACRPFLVSVPSKFWQHTRLQRNDAGLVDVKRSTLTGDDGIQSASRKNTIYHGIAFRLNVVYDMFVEEV